MSNTKQELLKGNTQENHTDDILPGYSSMEHFTKEGYKNLMQAIKHANSFPSGRDWNFYTTFESFKRVAINESNILIDSINSVLRKNEVGGNMRNSTLEKKTELLIDANDVILERVANNIDEMNGIRKVHSEPVVLHTVSAHLPVNINGSWNRINHATFSITSSSSLTSIQAPRAQSQSNTVRLITAENIVRPQKFFKDKIDNTIDNPWEPRIKDKPNSLKPLAIFLEETANGLEFSHPYEYELERFNPSDNDLTKTNVTKPRLLSDTPLIEITQPWQLQSLVDDLRQFKEIAVDLEHHSYRSFMGITCLMQISTVEKDYLIDTLELRDSLHILNEIFTRTDIVKIFHGAFSDIQWLQRDLSLYVVNMFDTHFASKRLEYSGLSLAYLMQRFCNFIPNKQFQLADWRIRPLPDELKNYAREDTHYLIYIYQNLRNELLERANGNSNLLRSVIQESTELCKKRYFKPIWRKDSHLEFYRKCNRMFDNRQMYALRELYKWRDHISREQDESTAYVLPNNMLLEISERLPREMQGILACCNPVPPLVRANLLELHKMILKALDQPFEEPILKEDIRARGATKIIAKINVDSPLHCPHDLTKATDFRDHLPTLLRDGNPRAVGVNAVLEKSRSACSVFNTPESSDDEGGKESNKKLLSFRDSFKFLGPYERYLLVRPFIRAKEKKLAEERAREEEERAKKRSGESQPEASAEADNRTDEERIESIREHFLQLARKPAPPEGEAPEAASLPETGGGSKKRKRDESIFGGRLHSDCETSESTTGTPVPNLHITLHTKTNTRRSSGEPPAGGARGRKRKSRGGETVERDAAKVPKLAGGKKKGNRLAEGQGESSQEDGGSQEDLASPESTPNKPAPRRGRGRGTSRGGGRNRPARGRQQPQHQASPDFAAYDYSMVDFRQFQGGAREAEKPKQFKSKFKPRGNKSKRGNRANNKSMSGRGQ